MEFQKEAEASRRLAELEKARADFLRLASHELRGPIGVLSGYVSLLDGGELGVLPPAAAKVVPILKAKIGEVNLMVEQMLETARLEDDRLQLRKDPADLRSLAREALDSVTVLADPTQEFRFDEPRDEVPVVVDKGRMGTIVSNLITNAIKDSPGGGEVPGTTPRLAGRVHVPRSGHAHVGVQRAPVGEAHQQVLAGSVDRRHRAAGQARQPRRARGQHAAAHQPRAQRGRGSPDGVPFRHSAAPWASTPCPSASSRSPPRAGRVRHRCSP